MAREVTHEATTPLRIDEDDIDAEKSDIAICRCGLSGEYPFCDGTHRVTEDEREGVRYRYERVDHGIERREIEQIVYADGPEPVS